MALVSILVGFAFAVVVCQCADICDKKYFGVATNVIEKHCDAMKNISSSDTAHKTYTDCIQKEYGMSFDDAVKTCSEAITGEQMDFPRAINMACMPLVKVPGTMGICCVVTKIMGGKDVSENADVVEAKISDCINQALGKGTNS